ncbi:thioredoxin fold domain-containing protein [Brumicola blandensis]|uniref:Thiol:disulfide interchange protein n=1 Tax=Brumicola blandensis TaxID=3075611 RepID=A0AAW8R4V4_9ALTE|nr:thioredoxin fold domain-containing protein [Alteromonas sp. W409]MDT0584321.1 thioredoxin fold domain-containing protein [Alteromonas sp. W409]
MTIFSKISKAATIFSVIIGISFTALAQEKNEHADLIERFERKLKFKIISVADSSVPGLLQINTDTGIFYASENGEYFLSARIYKVGDQIVDETGEALKKYRLAGVQQFKDSMIEFKADKEKYVVSVFTDATCGFCRKLHNEMDVLNDLGITVQYLAFPRAGINSSVYSNTVSIWCAEDPQEAMNKAKAGRRIASASCANEVTAQYNFGKAIGVNGTPNIILPDGSIINGYQPAKDLIETLKSVAKS